jgi:hypothetical protein
MIAAQKRLFLTHNKTFPTKFAFCFGHTRVSHNIAKELNFLFGRFVSENYFSFKWDWGCRAGEPLLKETD